MIAKLHRAVGSIVNWLLSACHIISKYLYGISCFCKHIYRKINTDLWLFAICINLHIRSGLNPDFSVNLALCCHWYFNRKAQITGSLQLCLCGKSPLRTGIVCQMSRCVTHFLLNTYDCICSKSYCCRSLGRTNCFHFNLSYLCHRNGSQCDHKIFFTGKGKAWIYFSINCKAISVFINTIIYRNITDTAGDGSGTDTL